MKCADCKFLVPDKSEKPNGGNCRRFPPQLSVVAWWNHNHDQPETDYYNDHPWVANDHWCGEFKEKVGAGGTTV